MFVNNDYRPSTELGPFDVCYTPAKPALKVMSGLYIYKNNYVDSTVFPKEKTAPPDRASTIKLEFGKAARRVIP
jgi:hypothetical protein